MRLHRGHLFAFGWLAFLARSVGDLLDGRRDPAQARAALLGLAAFVAVYTWFWLRVAYRGGAGPAAAHVAFGSVLLLTFTTSLGAGPVLAMDYLYVAVVAGVAYRLRPAVAAEVLTLAAAILSLLMWRAPAASVVTVALYITLTGAGMIAVNEMIWTNLALREAREEIARLAVWQERQRFARDLHDLLGHSLSIIVLKAELAGRLAAGDAARAAEEMRDVEQVARQALSEVREAVAGYRLPSLEQEIESARELLEAAGVECCVGGDPHRLPAPVAAVLAWGVREAATNVVRHSRARHCSISVGSAGDTATLEVTDDGVGPPGSRLGNGLRGLKERVAAQGGRLEVSSVRPGGFRLALSVPLPEGARLGGGSS